MDSRLTLAYLLAFVVLVQSATLSIQDNSLPGEQIIKRATWLPTRDTESSFTEMVYNALLEALKGCYLLNVDIGFPISLPIIVPKLLSGNGRIAKGIVNPKVTNKRGRYQGFCFRKLSNGRYLPYLCWKGDRR